MQDPNSPGTAWVPAGGPLGRLTTAALARAEAAASLLGELRARARDLPPPPPFAERLLCDRVAVIAEVKRASPSKGAIAPGLDAAAQAAAYERGGAAAVSVLTEPEQFGGSLDDLAAVTARVGLPAIRKDFIVDAVQLWEARVAGAAAALLIVRALAPDRLAHLADAAREIGLEVLVEIRDEAELARALAVDAQVIGVNNRDLETLVIHRETARTLIPRIPGDRVAVAESGIRGAGDVVAAGEAGADAVLVGSVISAASDPEAAVRALAGVPRRARSRR